MKLIFRYMKPYAFSIFLGMFLKLSSTLCELMLPYILEHLIGKVVPTGQMKPVIFWGLLMIATAALTRQLNVAANRRRWRMPTMSPTMCGRTCLPERPTCPAGSSIPSACPA